MSSSQKTIKQRFANNVSWIIGGRIYQMVINLVVSMVSVRYLGPSNYGLINYAASFSALFTAFCTLGMKDVLVNEIVQNPQKESTILGTSIFFRLVSSFMAIVTEGFLVMLMNPDEPLTVIVTLVYSTSLFFQSFDSLNCWYQAKLLSKVSSLSVMVGKTVVAVYKVLLLVFSKSVVWFAAANAVDFAVEAIILTVAYWKYRENKEFLCVSMKIGRELLGKSHHFIISGLMVTLYGQMDKIMIKHMMNETEVGYYSVSVAVCALWTFVLSSIIDSARPVILEEFMKDKEKYKKKLTDLYGAVLLISMFVAIMISIFAKLIVLILYGEAYFPAIDSLRIATWATAFSYIGVARSIWVVPHGQQKYEKYIAGAGVSANLILNYLLIPLWGINGAAFATLLTQFFTNVVSGFFIGLLRENNKLIIKAMNLPVSMKNLVRLIKK